MRLFTRDNKFRAIGFTAGFCSLAAITACNEATVQNVVTQAQQTVTQALYIASTVCDFLPTPATVDAILGKNDPSVLTGEQIGNAICTAVKASGATPANPLALLAGPLPPAVTQPFVLGVPIHGRFMVKPS